MGRTRKPCPGCGEVCQNRAADDVCSDCRLSFDALATLRKEIDRAIDNGYAMPVKLHGAKHWQPWICSDCDEVQDLFLKLCRAIGVRAWYRTERWGYAHSAMAIERDTEGLKFDQKRSGRSERPDEQYLIPVGAVSILPELYRAIGDLADQQYLRGHQEGRDLLMSLQAGSITVDDFNNQAIKIDEVYEP